MGKIKPMHVMNLPQTAKDDDSLDMWRNEMIKFRNFLEKEFKSEITDDKLRDAIKLVNKERVIMKKLHKLNSHKPAPLAGMDMMLRNT